MYTPLELLHQLTWSTMESKTSNALLEVWGWKEKAYQQIKEMPLDKAIEFIIHQTKSTAETLKKKAKERKND